MSTDEINRAIAEHLGIHAVRDKNSDLWSLIDGRFVVHGTHNGGLDEQHCWRVNCPDYCNDLNAMHEAEKTLNDVQCLFYPDNMREVITEHEASRRTWHATALQRAEAFLRTVGKWRDS